MPQKGFKTITVHEEIYNYATYLLNKYKPILSLKRIRSVSHLIEEALLYYAEKVLNDNIDENLEEILQR